MGEPRIGQEQAGTLAADMAHAARRPFAVLLPLLTLLFERSSADPELHEMLRTAVRSATDALSGIVDLISVLQPELDGLRVSPSAQRPEDLVTASIALLHAGISRPSVDIDNTLPPVAADPSHAASLLAVLCARSDDDGEIAIRVRMCGSAARSVCFTIGSGEAMHRPAAGAQTSLTPRTDCGCPVARAEEGLQERLDPALLICRALAGLHGGRLWLACRPRPAASSCLVLPAAL